MTYFKIGNVDFSHCVNQLKVGRKANYNAQTNAAGDTVVDFINQKRVIEVGIIPIDIETMKLLQSIVNEFNVSISYTDPKTGALVENVNCVIPDTDVEYYTIQANKVMFKEFALEFIEL